jgi:hypothetical protein
VPDLKVQNIRRTRSTEAIVVQEFDCTFHSLPPIAHTLRRIPGTPRSMTEPLVTVRGILLSGVGILRTVRRTLESMAKTVRSVSEMLWTMVGMLRSVRMSFRSKPKTVDSVRDVLGSVAGTLRSRNPMLRSVAGTWRSGETSCRGRVSALYNGGGFRRNAGRRGYPDGEIWSRFHSSVVLRAAHEGS